MVVLVLVLVSSTFCGFWRLDLAILLVTRINISESVTLSENFDKFFFLYLLIEITTEREIDFN